LEDFIASLVASTLSESSEKATQTRFSTRVIRDIQTQPDSINKWTARDNEWETPSATPRTLSGSPSSYTPLGSPSGSPPD